MTAESTVILIDKPAGPTSHDIVAGVRRQRGLPRRRRGGVKVGHAGTLDPFATGLLVVLTGRATRLQRYLLGLPKTYLATARLGWRSSTGDPDGELEPTGRMPRELALPTGSVRQRLPLTSAVKVDGERLYRRAHRGESFETPERDAEIYSADLRSRPDPERAEFEVTCAAGTYIRTLIETLADAYCESLRRTAIGHLQVPQAESRDLTPDQALAHLPARRLSEAEAEGVANGRPVTIGELDPPDLPTPPHGPSWEQLAEDRCRLLREGQLTAVARREGQELRPEVVLV